MKIEKIMCEHMLSDQISYRKAPFCIDTERPTFGFTLASDDAEKNIYVESYRITVSTFPNLQEADMWDSGFVDSNNIYCIKYEGRELKSKTTYYFRLQVNAAGNVIESPIGIFTTGIYYPSEWQGLFIGLPLEATPKLDCPEKDKVGLPVPYLRQKFTPVRKVISAKAYATACGVYELYINGEKAGPNLLAPEWTNYGASIQYQFYDLTDKLVPGENTLGAILGDGWFCGNVACVGRNQYGTAPLGFAMNLTLEYEDGSSEVIFTDDRWEGSSGPILYSDIQNGEYFDATIAPCNWQPVIYVNQAAMNGTRFKASMAPAIRELINIVPIKIEKDKNGLWIVDMGQNMVGHIEMKLHAFKDSKIVFRYGEMLNQDGTLYTTNLRTTLQTDTYIAKGDGKEVFKPHFTFHGFRYVEITGLEYEPVLEDIKGCVIYSSCPEVGEIETSNPMVNKLFQNALWGQRGNFVGLPTDCPQRDERMGWTGDAQVFCKTACYNMDSYAFFNKYTDDLMEAQKPNGAITDVAPQVKWPNGHDLVLNGNAAWGDAIFIIPYTIYEMYGDTAILEKCYGSMVKYFRQQLGTTKELLRPDFGFGDWLSIDDETPKDVMATAFFAYGAQIMSKTAGVLDKTDDANYYSHMFEQISSAWRKAYMDKDGKIKGDTQCCYLMALKMNLLPEDAVSTATAHLVRTIERKNYHLSTGFVGVSYLLPMLCSHGHTDIAYRLLLNDTYPSWGYSIKNGATTIWERWNSYTIENGFGDAGMNSFNHYSLGSVVEWMYAYMVGIRPKKPGWQEFYIKPYFTHKLEFVHGKYDSPAGKIEVSWKKNADGYELSVIVPPNTTAYVITEPSREVKCGSGTHTFYVKQ